MPRAGPATAGNDSGGFVLNSPRLRVDGLIDRAYGGFMLLNGCVDGCGVAGRLQ